MIAWKIASILLLVAANAFFVAGEFALVYPPDFIGEATNEILFMRDQKGGGSGAADAVQRHHSAVADQVCHAKLGQPCLPRAKKLTRPAQL